MEGMHYFIYVSHFNTSERKKMKKIGNDGAGNCHPLGGSRLPTHVV